MQRCAKVYKGVQWCATRTIVIVFLFVRVASTLVFTTPDPYILMTPDSLVGKSKEASEK